MLICFILVLLLTFMKRIMYPPKHKLWYGIIIGGTNLSEITIHLFNKMAAGGHFGWRKITFDRISHHFRSILNFLFFKMVASCHFGSRCLPKSIGTYLYSRSVATSNMKLIGAFVINLWSAQDCSSYFHKIAVGGHFGFPIFSKFDRVLPL